MKQPAQNNIKAVYSYLCTSMLTTKIKRATKKQYPQLLEVWEKSVRATHHFLAEADIQHYKPLILEQYFDQLQLFCAVKNSTILGFIGLDGSLIQMLFVDPKARGLGIGKLLTRYAIYNHKVTEVDVNEQNEQAVGFYKHLGFEVIKRAELDSEGKPYPILSMRLK
jgi:putative acetyltransferase